MDKRRDGDRVGVGVGGRLKQRLAQILLHSSCATTSATAFVSLANTNAARTIAGGGSRREPPAAAAAAPGAREARPKVDGGRRRRRRSRGGSRPLVHISIDCSSVRAAGTTSSRRSAGVAALLPSPTPPVDDGKVKMSRARSGDGSKPRSPSYSCSSSTVTDDELAPFSSDGERGEGAETRSTATLFSSLSFSDDSTSDLYSTTGHRKNPRRRAPARGSKLPDTLRPTVSANRAPRHDKVGGEGKSGGGGAADSMAVVKRSHNPYVDFRSSMVEMVVERRICRADSMGELLVSYLSLNSPRHHPAILAAFKDVWEVVFLGK